MQGPTDPRWGHYRCWSGLVEERKVPPLEYGDVPKGRVMFDSKTERFTLLADRCILRREKIVAEIVRRMGLPVDLDKVTGSHYVCPACPRAIQKKAWGNG